MKEKFSNIISHRGYHGNGIVENTMLAFSKSISYSLPIELDVYLTKDSKLVVFHDSNLNRLMGVDKKIEDCNYSELLKYSFLDGKGTIPLFSEVLELVSGKVPLLIEVKRAKNYHKTCRALMDSLLNYSGKVQIQSFDFRIVRWFLKKKKYLAGLLISSNPKEQYYWYYLLVNSAFFVKHFVRPNFVSYDLRGVPTPFLKEIRAYGIPIYLWTIRTKKDLKLAHKYGDYYIAEELDSFN